MGDSVYDYNHLGNRFNKVVSLLIIVVLCFMIFYFVTSAWFGESEVATKVYIVGDIELKVETTLEFPKDLLEPNKLYDNMPTTITCAPNTDDAYIKVRLETDYQVDGHHVMFPVLHVTPEHEANGEQSWIYSDKDDCYYYVGYITPDITATFNTGIVITNDIDNVDKSKPVHITLTVYSIQRYYSAYAFEESWANNAPDEWREAIRVYDVRDCKDCANVVVGADTPCPECGSLRNSID